MRKFQINLVVETKVLAKDAAAAAALVAHVEQTIQHLLDTRAKRFDAVVGADYGDVTEVEA